MQNKVIYICSWSVLLLIATFTELFQTGDFIKLFDVHGQTFAAAKNVFLLPLLFAVLLSGIDVVYMYNLEKSKGQNLDLYWVLVFILLFMGTLAAAIFYSNVYLTATGFFMAWLSLTGMKFAATEKCKKGYPVIREIKEN